MPHYEGRTGDDFGHGKGSLAEPRPKGYWDEVSYGNKFVRSSFERTSLPNTPITKIAFGDTANKISCPMSLLTEHPNSRRHGLSAGVVKRLEKQIKSDSTPVFEKLVTWRNLLSFVDQAEEFLLEDASNVELKAVHRSVIELSIVLGETLLKEEGISQALEQLSCTVGDFKAKLRMLRYQDRMWHSDLNSEKSEMVLKSLFGALP